MHKKYGKGKIKNFYVPVTDAETVPQLRKLLVECQVETDLVLDFNTLLNDNLLQVRFQSKLLKFSLKLFYSVDKVINYRRSE